jgi:hypothetical protein
MHVLPLLRVHSVNRLAAVVAPNASLTVAYLIFRVAILAGLYLWLTSRRK